MNLKFNPDEKTSICCALNADELLSSLWVFDKHNLN